MILLTLTLLVIACAPATNPYPPEIPATEEPASTEVPLPEVAKITFVYEYNYVPESWVKNYAKKEVVTFYSSQNEWESRFLSPIFIDKGPLFPIQLDYINNKSGQCPIDSYFQRNEQGQQFEVKPLCRNFDPEETAIASVRIPNCDRDASKKLICTYPSDFGVLKYTLNEAQDTFEYQYLGSWDLSFESAINSSLTHLGFNLPGEEFYRSSVENEIYTLKK